MIKKTKLLLSKWLYAYIATLLLAWWLFAFSSQNSSDRVKLAKEAPRFQKSKKLPSKALLQEALFGKLNAMKIIAWDLQDKIEKEKLQEMQELIKKLENSSPPQRDALLAQTYLAAELLGAIVESESLVALPSEIRSSSLISESLKAAVPLDCHRLNSEKIFLKKPRLAVVASYSNPAMLNSLKKQAIKLLFSPTISEINECFQFIEDIGKPCLAKDKARLMRLFSESCFFAIEAILKEEVQAAIPLIYLNETLVFSTASSKSLTYSLLSHLPIENLAKEKVERSAATWSLNLSIEEILALKPQALIISSKEKTLPQALQAISSRFVDPDLQSSQSQMSVLAFYELAAAILELSA